MGLFGNKFNKIKRSDVVDTIISLEKQQQEILEQIENRNKSCDEFMKKGKLEKDTNMRMYYAKKISTMKKENLLDTKRLQFIDSNILSMQQLKNALDDKEFIKNNSKMSLNQMLSKPAELRSFIAKINNDKMKREEQVAENLTTFEEINEEYIENEKIYSADADAENILAMFEMSDQLEDELKAGQKSVDPLAEFEQPQSNNNKITE